MLCFPAFYPNPEPEALGTRNPWDIYFDLKRAPIYIYTHTYIL